MVILMFALTKLNAFESNFLQVTFYRKDYRILFTMISCLYSWVNGRGNKEHPGGSVCGISNSVLEQCDGLTAAVMPCAAQGEEVQKVG